MTKIVCGRNTFISLFVSSRGRKTFEFSFKYIKRTQGNGKGCEDMNWKVGFNGRQKNLQQCTMMARMDIIN